MVSRAGYMLRDKLLCGVEHLAICSRIARAAKRYRRLQAELCSGPHYNVRWDRSAEWQAGLDVAAQRARKRIGSLVAQLGAGFGVEFSCDPRGKCVYITTPDGRYDDLCQRGICAEQDN